MNLIKALVATALVWLDAEVYTLGRRAALKEAAEWLEEQAGWHEHRWPELLAEFRARFGDRGT